MKDMRTVSKPFLESKARTLMYFALCAFRQAVTSSMTPAGSLMSNMGWPHMSQ